MSNQLRQILDSIFPASYLKQNHSIEGCSLLQLCCRQDQVAGEMARQSKPGHLCRVSSEPGSRGLNRQLANQLDASLAAHRAKPSGLCPVRRTIYEQCFDELIRQATVNCLEFGLLLFRVRNELKASLAAYELAYESAISYGMSKALESELEQETSRQKVREMEAKHCKLENQIEDNLNQREVDHRNDLDAAQRTKLYLEKELAKRDQIIEQQRAIIKSLSQEIV